MRWCLTGTVFFALACGGGANKPVKTGVVGESLRFDGWSITVKGSARQGLVKTGLLKHGAGSGAELLLVDVEVSNSGKRPMSMVGSLWLDDAESRRFDVTGGCMFALGKRGLGMLEQIQPGLSKRGKVCFEVPKGLEAGVQIKPSLLQPPVRVAL